MDRFKKQTVQFFLISHGLLKICLLYPQCNSTYKSTTRAQEPVHIFSVHWVQLNEWGRVLLLQVLNFHLNSLVVSWNQNLRKSDSPLGTRKHLFTYYVVHHLFLINITVLFSLFLVSLPSLSLCQDVSLRTTHLLLVWLRTQHDVSHLALFFIWFVKMEHELNFTLKPIKIL